MKDSNKFCCRLDETVLNKLEDELGHKINVKNVGLRGVTVADTKISFIDGARGVLIYRGYRVEQLAQESSFMEVAYLLLNGFLPQKKELTEFEEQVKKARHLPGYSYEILKKYPKEAVPTDVLQSAVMSLAMADPNLLKETREAHVMMAIRLMAGIPALVAAWHRIRRGYEPLPSDDDLPHAANFLWQIHGKKPDEEIARDLDACFILHADHTFNASTFACRDVVSTRAHMYAGICAGIGALSGILHGGANTRVMKMLRELETKKDIAGWIKNRLDGGKKIMGMGHAVYKTMDPRAEYLKDMAASLGKKTGQERWFHLSAEIERIGIEEFQKRGRTNIWPNVDFYSAPVYHMMGIPLDIMTPVFAIARVAGWCAHIIEEKFAEAQGKPALYRPVAEYVGLYDGLAGITYEPLESRTN